MKKVILFCIFSYCFWANSQNLTQVNKIVDTESYSFNPFDRTSIYGLTATGIITLHSDSSFCRIIMVDETGHEYMLYEAYMILTGLETTEFVQEGEETSLMNRTNPSNIIVQTKDASCNVKSISFLTEEPSDLRQLKSKKVIEVAEMKAKKINENIKKFGMLWSAKVSQESLLSYEKKKSIYGDRYNLRGYEYYHDGFFQSSLNLNLGRSQSLITPSWDWRSRHNANNPHKPDGSSNSCYYDGDPDGSGWMTPLRFQDGCWLNGELQPYFDPECSNLGGTYIGVPTCWAFSPCNVTEAVENLYFNDHFDPHLSEQDIIMCSGWGYSGGFESTTFSYLRNNGVVDWDCYPYPAAATPCSTKCSNPTEVTSINNYVGSSYSPKPEDAIKEMLIQHGPITCRPPWAHTYCLVGYDLIKQGDQIDGLGTVPAGSPYIGTTYWIVKNSAVEQGYGTSHYGYNYTLDLPLPYYYYVELPVYSTLHDQSEIRILDCDGDGFYNWGIGPKPSWAPSGIPDEEDCDDTDPRLRGQDPITYNCLINCNNFSYISNPEHISTNTLWQYDNFKDHDVIVDNGAILTVKARISFASQAKLIIQPGGRVILDGGTFTSPCSTWLGVEVWGNSSLSQSFTNQGYINVLHGGTIENAEIGILLGRRSGSGYDDNYTGGIAIVNGSNTDPNLRDAYLLNNTIAVSYRPYTAYASISQFIRTIFIVDASYQGRGFQEFIKSESIKGVRVFGCKFENSLTSDPSGIGIRATDAGLVIGAQCTSQVSPCPEGDMMHNEFINLSRGIYDINTGVNYTVSISRSNFTNVTNGIYLSAFINPAIIINTFTVPGNMSDPQTMVPPYGLYLDNCTGYQVEDNTFQSVEASPNSAGVIVNNSGIAANEIYRNRFYDLKYGSIAQDVNKHPTNTTGLCFLCNTYKSTDAEIGVTRTGNYSQSVGVAEYQRQSNGYPTFNLFTVNTATTHWDFYNEGYNVRYYYSNMNPPQNWKYTLFKKSVNVTLWPDNNQYSNFCPSKIGNGGQPIPDGMLEGGNSIQQDRIPATTSPNEVINISKLKKQMDDNDISGAYARNILIAGGYLTYQEPFIAPKNVKEDLVSFENSNDNFSIYPNPAEDFIIVNKKSAGNFTLKIINYLGKQVFVSDFNVASKVISTQGFSDGMYIINIFDKDSLVSSIKLSISK